MGFIFFLLATAALLIRPAEQFAELRGFRLYETLILLSLAGSLSSVLEQFTIKNLETRPITIFVFGLLAAVLLSHLSQGNAALAGENGFEFFKILVFYVLLVGNITTTFRLRVFTLCLGFCAVAFVSFALLQYYEVITVPEPEPDLALLATERPRGNGNDQHAFVKERDYDPETGQMVELKRLRGTGIFRDPNDLCLLLTMGIFIALYGLSDKHQGVFRLAWLGALLLFFFALSMTYSRGGLLGMLGGMLALLYARFGWRGALALGVPLLPIALAIFGGRMANISPSEGTGQTRVQVWSDGIAAMMSAPLFGIGLNELGTAGGKVAHNSFLGAYAELGLFGGTLFFGAFFFALLTLGRILKYRREVADAELQRLLPFLTAILVSYCVGILSLSRVDAVPTYLLLGLVTVAGNLAVVQSPALTFRLDSRLMQRMAVASIGYLAASYIFVRVFKA